MTAVATTPAYQALTDTFRRLHHLEHLQSIAYWDRAAKMPPSGAAARAAALAEVAAISHRLRTSADMPVLLADAAQEPLADDQRANLREMQREWRAANALPDDLVQRSKLASARCEHAWRSQRQANDWPGFAANFREVVENAREQARRRADAGALAPYDALLDEYEPEMTGARLDALFGEVRQWLPGLIQRVRAHQSAQTEPLLPLRGPFELGAQRALCQKVAALLGFDFKSGRIDVSTHPFAGGVPEDVRLTTRYESHEFITSLLGVVHECGHGRYEQCRPRDWLGQPLSQARSMGIHESQSLSFEMQLARHPGFTRLLAPLLRQAFGDQQAFEPANLRRLLTRVKPGLIRVDADEVTYAAHVLLRYGIERPLIEGAIEVDDIPALWDAGMAELLGLDSRGNYCDGPMQDVHWPEGIFGYFPCYTLGAMYAAQWFATMRAQMPDLDQHIDAGDLQPIFTWLETHIWREGSRWPTDELARRASGEALNPAYWRNHLERRYLRDAA